MIRKQGPWSLWWLTGITLGIYYFVWYQRVNDELVAMTGRPAESWGAWWSQLVPIYGAVGLHHTAVRLNDAHAAIGSPTRVSPTVAWLWAPVWFGSHTRYLQRRMNLLADAHAVRGATIAQRTP
ncbi:DUF4234 domain-containing protein [Gordonia shandongensis]|uniref:DUF4234 domain-containing protein n=1 Tax=Gordonia shandongensis TaxID=376351 RepID=UPI00040C7570|nr:DUF4234 domain-containing protein [Gordonia shandongensis]